MDRHDANTFRVRDAIASGLRRLQDGKRYARVIGSFYGLAGLQLLAQLALVPVYLDTIGKVSFGALMTVLAIVNAAGLGIAWLQGSFLRAIGMRYFAGPDGRREALGPAYSGIKLLCLGYGALASLVIAALAYAPPQWLFGEDAQDLAGELRWLFLLAGIYQLVLSDLSSEYWMLTATKHQTEANIALSVSPAAFVALVIPWLFAGGSLPGVMACMVVGAIASNLTIRLLRRRKVGAAHFRVAGDSLAILRSLAGRQAGPYAVYGIAFTILQLDTLIVATMAGAGQVAEFVLVWKIAEILVLLLWKIPESLQPYLIEAETKGDTQRIARLYRSVALLGRSASLVVGLVYAFFGPEIVTLWVGQAHAPVNDWTFALAGGAIFWLGSARAPALFAYVLRRFSVLNPIILAELSAKLALTAAFVPWLGYGAPLAATNVTHLFGAAWAYVWLGRRTACGGTSAASCGSNREPEHVQP